MATDRASRGGSTSGTRNHSVARRLGQHNVVAIVDFRVLGVRELQLLVDRVHYLSPNRPGRRGSVV